MGRVAAFFDVDGTLVKTNVIHSYAYTAFNLPSLADRFTRALRLAAALPIYGLVENINRKTFNDLFYKNYEGISEDRLIALGEEFFENVLRRALYPRARSLIQRGKEQGIHQVMVTGALDFTMAPLARYLGMDLMKANELEYRDGFAVGTVKRPLLAGPTKAHWIRQYAQENDIDLDRSFAYADSYSDYPMLSLVGRPCAVNPEMKLRSAARAFDWPIMNLA